MFLSVVSLFEFEKYLLFFSPNSYHRALLLTNVPRVLMEAFFVSLLYFFTRSISDLMVSSKLVRNVLFLKLIKSCEQTLFFVSLNNNLGSWMYSKDVHFGCKTFEWYISYSSLDPPN